VKDVTFTVEFVQHVLANSGLDGKQCVFQRTRTGLLVFQQSWWHSAFARGMEGVDDLRHLKPGDISVGLIVDAPTEMFQRRYGVNRYRVHEAIMPGTIVTFTAIVDDRVTESNLKTLLNRVGKYIGLSPFGHKLGYGMFQLLGLRVQPSEARRRLNGATT
jgi:hypothetical protein